jgi:hypothetical protein
MMPTPQLSTGLGVAGDAAHAVALQRHQLRAALAEALACEQQGIFP